MEELDRDARGAGVHAAPAAQPMSSESVREAAARIKCANNLKQIGLAFHNYHEARDRLPPFSYAPRGHSDGGTPALPPGVGSKHYGVFLQLMPYIEQDPLARKYDPTKGPTDTTDADGDGYTNRMLIGTPIPLFLCPSMPTPSKTCPILPTVWTGTPAACSSSM